MSIDVQHFDINCLCAALSVVLTGDRSAGYKLQRILVRMRKHKRFNYLYDLPGADVLVGGPDNIELVNTTDMRMLTRLLGLNIYLYVFARDGKPAHWEVYRGSHKGHKRAGIYFEMIIGHDGNDHVKLVYRVREIKNT